MTDVNPAPAAPETQVNPAQSAPAAAEPAAAPAESSAPSVSDGRAPMPDNPAGAEGQNPSSDEPGDLLTDSQGSESEANSPTLGAPEEGYSFKPAEGTNVHLDEASYKQFAEVAKELNLSQEAAQKIVDKMEPMLQARVNTLRKAWMAESRQDAEFGGANFETNIKAINRAYLATTTPELREVLKASGLVNHPEVLRHFYGLSKALGDGTFITSKGAQERADRSDPRNFYKGMNP